MEYLPVHLLVINLGICITKYNLGTVLDTEDTLKTKTDITELIL